MVPGVFPHTWPLRGKQRKVQFKTRGLIQEHSHKLQFLPELVFFISGSSRHKTREIISTGVKALILHTADKSFILPTLHTVPLQPSQE